MNNFLPIPFRLLLFSVLSISSVAFSQETAKIPLNFNDQEAGRYRSERLEKDWSEIEWAYMERANVVSKTDAHRVEGGKCLRVRYLAGKIGAKEGGAAFRAKIQPSKEYYLDYYVRFGHGNGDHWEFSRGGKLPGLGGGECNTGGNKTTGDGWSVRYMWRDGGRMVAYVYHLDQKTRYGDQIPLNRDFLPGKWYRLTQRVRVNTEGEKNGVLQVWVDGGLVLNRKDIRFQSSDKAPVDHFLFSTFYGGGDKSWAPKINTQAYFDEIRIQIERPEKLEEE